MPSSCAPSSRLAPHPFRSKVPVIRCLDADALVGGSGGTLEDIRRGVQGGGLHMGVDVSGLGLTADEVADVLMEEADVCVVPISEGEQHLIRICIAADEVALKDSIRRVAVCLMSLARDMAVD